MIRNGKKNIDDMTVNIFGLYNASFASYNNGGNHCRLGKKVEKKENLYEELYNSK